MHCSFELFHESGNVGEERSVIAILWKHFSLFEPEDLNLFRSHAIFRKGVRKIDPEAVSRVEDMIDILSALRSVDDDKVWAFLRDGVDQHLKCSEFLFCVRHADRHEHHLSGGVVDISISVQWKC